MRIAVLGVNYYPEVTGIGVYTTQMCEYLAAQGHQMEVFTGFPYYPFGEDFSFWYKQKRISRLKPLFSEDINGVRVRRVNFYKPKQPNVLKRILHETSFLAALTIRLIFVPHRQDALICISPPLFLGLVAYVFSRARGIPFIFHIKDLQPDAGVELGMLKKGMFTSFLYAVEKFIYKKAKFVLTISEGMRTKIVDKGIAQDKTGLFYDWVDTQKIKPLPRDNSFSAKHSLSGKFVVLHAGNMGEKQDMRVIMDTAEKLKDDRGILFLLIGGGPKRKFVEAAIKGRGLANVLLLNVQPNEVLNEMFSSCEAALITQTKNVRDIVMPSKVFGPAAAGKPVIIAADSNCEIAKIALKYNFGLVIYPQSPEELAGAIYRLRNDNNAAAELGRNGRAFMLKERSIQKVINDFRNNFLQKLERDSNV